MQFHLPCTPCGCAVNFVYGRDASTSSTDLSLTQSSMQLTINSQANRVLLLFITAWFSQELQVSTKMNIFTSKQYKLEMPFTGPKISCFPGSHP